MKGESAASASIVPGVSTAAEAPTQPRGVPTGRASGLGLAARAAAVCGPAAITVYLAFRSGGFFAGAPGLVAVVLGVALTLRITLAEAPFAGFGGWLIAAATGLGLYAAWTLASALWSHAPAQAMIEFDRALMYWLALVLFGSLPWNRETLLWAVRVAAGAMIVVAAIGLVTRVLPSVHSIPTTFENYRLSYPLSYWNALGLFVGVTTILSVGLATRREEPLVSKSLFAAAVPVLTATLYFTFSRGAIAVLVAGLILFLVLVAGRELISSVLAIAPPTAVVIVYCLQTDALSTERYADAAGVSEGHKASLIVLACALAAGVLRALLSRLDLRLDAVSVSRKAKRRTLLGAAAALALVVVVVGVATDAPRRIGNGFDQFTETKGINDSGKLQNRLTSVNNNGRLVQWRLALDTFAAEPFHGSGAGTFARIWAKEGTDELKVVDAHSLYLEVMAEFGVPGLVFLLVALLAIFGGLATRIRGPDRVIYAALIAAAATWAVHAGFDWDWEMPATGLWLFALGGMAIARSGSERAAWSAPTPGRVGRAALGIGCLALLVTPALVALSQSKLNAAVDELEAGRCDAASDDALAAVHLLSARPEPYQVLGFCDSRAGQNGLAISLLQTAVSRDAGEWESYYGLALVRGAAGKDPRPAARRALALAPNEPLAQEAVRIFKTNDPQKWRRRALKARLPIL